MKKFYFLALPLLLAACASFSDSEVIVRASPEERPSKSHMQPTEKPLQVPHGEAHPIPPIAPQIGVRLPLGK